VVIVRDRGRRESPTSLRWSSAPVAKSEPWIGRHASEPERQVTPPATVLGGLVAGFAVVFALWFLSGYELVRRLGEVEARVAQTHADFSRNERTLSTVRTNILLGSIYLRDALIDTSGVTRQYYRDELTQIRSEIERLVPAYVLEVQSPLERQHWTELQTALDQYWASLDVVFEDAPRGMTQGTGIMRRVVVPARENVLKIVDTLTALQRLGRQGHDVEVSLLYADVRTRLLAIGSFAIVVGLLVAWFATGHVRRLHREIERQRLAERQNRLDLERLSARLVHVQEEERRSLSRELHDAVGQALTAIKMGMGVAMRSFDPQSPAKRALEDARAITETTLQNVRDLSQVLHPSMLDDFGLPEAVNGYLRNFSKRTSVRTQLTTERMDERLSSDIEVCVYRIVQEATTNVARHSGATVCTVALERREGMLQLLIEDDGRGIDAAKAGSSDARRGLGLIGMRERAQTLSGTFVIENRPEGGTRVRVRLPILEQVRESHAG
jgi:signal transduction histidine kinase